VENQKEQFRYQKEGYQKLINNLNQNIAEMNQRTIKLHEEMRREKNSKIYQE